MSSPRTRVTLDSCMSRFCVKVDVIGDQIDVYVFSNATLVAHDSSIRVLDELINELKTLKEEVTAKLRMLEGEKSLEGIEGSEEDDVIL